MYYLESMNTTNTDLNKEYYFCHILNSFFLFTEHPVLLSEFKNVQSCVDETEATSRAESKRGENISNGL